METRKRKATPECVAKQNKKHHADEPLNKLIENQIVLNYVIFPILDAQSKAHAAQACRGLHALFKKPLNDYGAAQLRYYVSRGEQAKAEKILQSRPDFIFSKGGVIDYSDRSFRNISALQYAAWAYDIHMLKMLLRYVPEDQAQEVLEQLEELENKKTEHGAHYNVEEFKIAAQNSNTVANERHTPEIEERLKAIWINEVGMAQRNFPVHVVNEYCRLDRSFTQYPQPPTFKEETLPRILTVYDETRKSNIEWFPLTPNQGPGFEFAITRWSSATASANDDLYVDMDLDAITTLFATRALELEEIKQLLRDLISKNSLRYMD